MESTEIDAPTGSHSLELPFKSKLQDAQQRFLAYALEHGIRQGRRTPKDFIRHFPPKLIMEGLEDEPQLRANILVTATGIRMKVALKKSATSCGSDLQIALDENEADADIVVKLFGPDDRVRFLDNKALWSFLIEGAFWQVDAKKEPKAHALAAEHIGYLIERALEDQLLTHRDVVRGITVASMTELLPRSELPKILEAALELGQAKKPFMEKNLLEAIGISTLTAHIPLPNVWNQVVVPFIAEPHGLMQKVEARGSARDQNTDEAAREKAAAPAQEAPRVRPPESGSTPLQIKLPGGTAAGPRAAASAAPPAAPPSAVAAAPAAGFSATAVKAPALGEDSGLDLEVDEILGSLTAGKPTTKKAARRPGSIPPGP